MVILEKSIQSHLPEKYNDVTLFADGTHCLIYYSPFESEALHKGEDLAKKH